MDDRTWQAAGLIGNIFITRKPAIRSRASSFWAPEIGDPAVPIRAMTVIGIPLVPVAILLVVALWIFGLVIGT